VKEILHVGFGGLLGAVTRFMISRWLARLWTVPGHVATLVINGGGSFLLGLTLGLGTGAGRPIRGQLFLTVGFCGSFTTFSSWVSDVAALADQASPLSALDHIFVSLGLSLLLFAVGVYLGRQVAAAVWSS